FGLAFWKFWISSLVDIRSPETSSTVSVTGLDGSAGGFAGPVSFAEAAGPGGLPQPARTSAASAAAEIVRMVIVFLPARPRPQPRAHLLRPCARRTASRARGPRASRRGR